jgi:anti-sigma factor RsiW
MIMPRFSKRHDCPSSEVLSARAAGALSPRARAGVAAHLSSCDFCGAESQLLARAVETFETTPAPEMPLALRLFTEGRLAEAASVAAFKNLRAA